MSFNKRLFTSWLLGILFSYAVLGYLGNFYRSAIETVLLTFIIHAGIALFGYYLVGRVIRAFRENRTDTIIAGILYLGAFLFVPAMYTMAAKFPNLFDNTAFNIAPDNQLYFLIGLVLAFPLAMWGLSFAKQKNFDQTGLYRFIDENLHGILIALLFFAVYLIFASIFNRPSYDADDVFFDADGNLYRWRFATPNYRDYYWRPAHPYVLLIIRPLVAIITFFFKGDSLFATFTLNALVGALCVFLVWYFVKNVIGNQLYALLTSAIFAATSTQLAFGSILETYIYLSAVALFFLILLLKDKSLAWQVFAGVVTFGITFSNILQTVFAHFFVKRNIKQLFIYGVLVGVFAILLSFVNNAVYPNSQPYFWDVSTLEGEGHNQFPPTFQRADYLARVMVLHSFVAPEPLVIRDGFPFPKVWMFRASIKKDPMQLARYHSLLGNGLAIAWAGLMILGVILFLKNIKGILKKENGYFLAFAATILFNFAFYMQYGKDVFLYATNWTYAILLFLALAWRELADKRWFQIVLLIFFLLLLVNNSGMLYTMLKISAPTVKFSIWR